MILTVILLLGAGLRIIGMTWGLPYQLEPDEPVLFINAWERWSTGEPTLKNEYPPLYLYVLVWQREFIDRIFCSDTPQVIYFFFGRWNSILISLLLITAAYRLGKAAGGWASGIAFALFMALEPISVQQLGWIIKVDNLAWLFTLLTLFATIIAGRQRSWRWLALACFLGILATLTKYNFVFVFVAPSYIVINWRL
ncbi:MAG TPA: glycosyltransferase family 39 protein, partial [Aggregatilineales bacterium]|nr:glycosyltransferase family 39 protein [Aggregatilineales bacterium]